jgi:hypothetical protein
MEKRLRDSRQNFGSFSLNERLAASSSSAPAPAAAPMSSFNSQYQQAPLPAPAESDEVFEAPPPLPEKDYSRRGHAPAPLDHHQWYDKSRPGTARQGQQAVPGALPPTPVASEGTSSAPL